MTRSTKIALVLIGYALAVVAAIVASFAYEAAVNKPGVDTSGGMYAFGSMLQILAAFGVAALVPTGLALWFIRKNEAVWRVVSRVALAVAMSGPLFGLLFMSLGNPKTPHPELGPLVLPGIIRLICSPFLAVVFVAAALLATGKSSRALLWIAAVIEAAVTVGGAGRFLGR